MPLQHWVKHFTPLWHLNLNMLLESSFIGSMPAKFSGLSISFSFLWHLYCSCKSSNKITNKHNPVGNRSQPPEDLQQAESKRWGVYPFWVTIVIIKNMFRLLFVGPVWSNSPEPSQRNHNCTTAELPMTTCLTVSEHKFIS